MWLWLLLAMTAGPSAPLEVDGVALGLPLPELRQLRGPNFHCGEDYDPDAEEAIAQAVCYTRDPSHDFATALTFRPDRFAGRPTAFFFWILEDRVGWIALSLPSKDFGSILSELEKRYGKPEISRHPLRMAEGGTLENTVARWRIGGQLIRFSQRYAYNEEISPMDFFSARYLEALAARGVPSP